MMHYMQQHTTDNSLSHDDDQLLKRLLHDFRSEVKME